MAKPRDLLHMIEDTNALNSKIGKMIFVKLRQGSGKDRQGIALEAKGLKA